MRAPQGNVKLKDWNRPQDAVSACLKDLTHYLVSHGSRWICEEASDDSGDCRQ